MHEIQQKILTLSKNKDLGRLSLRKIGTSIGVDHPQQVKYHLEQLISRGFLEADIFRNNISHVSSLQDKGSLSAIPILGEANAGPATQFADESFAGYLRISRQLLPKHIGKLFGIRVTGDSMNQAEVNNKKIEDGDYVIVDSGRTDPSSGEIVLSIIDDVANIKRLLRDGANKQLVLASDSEKNYTPIYIHEDDHSSYSIGGVVVDVFKKPN